jgi:hypothetical protein
VASQLTKLDRSEFMEARPAICSSVAKLLDY